MPAEPYVLGHWTIAAAVNLDYHVAIERNFYSVPHAFARKRVDVFVTRTAVQVFHRGERVASHARLSGHNRWATLGEHMPPAHSAVANRTPDWVRSQAAGVGVATAAYVERLLTGRDHIEQGVRSCLGILRLATRYPAEQLEAACVRALAAGRTVRPASSSTCSRVAGRPTRRSPRTAPATTATSAAPITITDHHAVPIEQKGTPMYQPTIEKLHALRLGAMADALAAQLRQPEIDALPFSERLALLVDIQHSATLNAALEQRLRRAGMRQSACVENLDLRTPRGFWTGRVSRRWRADNGSASTATC